VNRDGLTALSYTNAKAVIGADGWTKVIVQHSTQPGTGIG
jgi:hypothetical protein